MIEGRSVLGEKSMERDMREHSGVLEMFSNLTVVMVTQLCTLIRTNEAVYLDA